ncbi:hypothetical protein HII28_04520 [Planctomonas sp. JC2975]|uniref:hypothetical protein n=1 Tax=Planctomonas sp. JC2975 TaxID=2729626 RepID=UPI001473BB50|nr:hypothetical protein [Planctomonas sp. JC2975]NNC11142.1 hypothetical protein [Planctomonas sp. JC2975]
MTFRYAAYASVAAFSASSSEENSGVAAADGDFVGADCPGLQAASAKTRSTAEAVASIRRRTSMRQT